MRVVSGNRKWHGSVRAWATSGREKGFRELRGRTLVRDLWLDG